MSEHTASPLHFSVTGMSCGHCESAVRQEVGALDGVAELSVSAQEGTLTVTPVPGAQLSDQAVIAAVDEAGYQAVRS